MTFILPPVPFAHVDTNPSDHLNTNTAIMDEDLAFALIAFLFLSFPFLIVLAITGSMAYSRTRAWDKARHRRSVGLESETNRLVADADADSEDFCDTEDEEEHKQRQAEEEADRFLTFGQKFRKEHSKLWSGKGGKDIAKKKEREDRRKLAKAVVREMARVERRKIRKADAEAADLPPYKKE